MNEMSAVILSVYTRAARRIYLYTSYLRINLSIHKASRNDERQWKQKMKVFNEKIVFNNTMIPRDAVLFTEALKISLFWKEEKTPMAKV